VKIFQRIYFSVIYFSNITDNVKSYEYNSEQNDNNSGYTSLAVKKYKQELPRNATT
jgi:hypothetical protein